MSKEEYAAEINPLATFYEKGRRDERNRILTLIGKKEIANYEERNNIEVDYIYKIKKEVFKEIKNDISK